MTRARRGLLRVAAVLLVAIAVSSAGTAAAAPSVAILSPANGSVSNNSMPTFSGVAQEGGGKVTLEICRGPCTSVTFVESVSTELFGPGGTWSFEPIGPLADGTYIAL